MYLYTQCQPTMIQRIQLRKPLLSQVEAAMMMTMTMIGVMWILHYIQFQRKTGKSGNFPLTPTPTPRTLLNQGRHQPQLVAKPIPMTTRLPPEKQGASGGTAETSFSQTPSTTLQNRACKEIKDDFSKADWSQIEVRDHTQYTKEGKPSKTIIEIKLRNKGKWYPLFTKSRGDENKTFN